MTDPELQALIAQAKDEQWEELDLSGRSLTELPPQIGELTQLKRLILGKYDEEKNEWIGNALTTLPETIAQLTQLEVLSIVDNQLTEIPAWIAQLQNLTTLSLSSNQITEIPEAIAQLKNLTELYLWNNQITEIPEAIAQLQNLTELYLWNNQITEIPEAIAQLQNLTTLYLSSNQITEIPEAIAQLQNLTSLDLSSNQITQIPEAIAQLQNLTTLYLWSNQITEIPEAIAQLQNLTTLNLWSNQITEIPEAIAQLKNLTELRIGSNQLNGVPEWIRTLTKLTALNIAKCQLTEVPNWITELSNLKELYLWENQITEIPEAIAQLQNLTKLYLSSNQITEIPEAIAQLQNLTTLSLSSNQITQIPEAIAQLKNLTELSIYSNQLNGVPEWIRTLTKLTVLNIAKCQLTEVPNWITELSNLKELYLWENQITEIPEAIAQLQNLTKLYLSSNQITQIPEAIAELQNLTELHIDSNQLNGIPEWVCKLTKLTVLNIGKCQLTEVPAWIAKLSNLKDLTLWDNQIAEISEAITQLQNLAELDLDGNQITVIPERIAQLQNLTKLDLGNNQITEIPEAIAQLQNLTTLYLNSNKITEISEAIAQLQNLTTLNLWNNQITQIPEAIAQLKNLKDLDLRGNPISIPPEVLDYRSPSKGDSKAPDAQPILDYYFTTRDPEQTQTLYEAKLLLVGEGGAGKTSLANKLRNPDYTLKSETEDTSTQGIDILKWEFIGRNGSNYSINIWDFGGQEIYHQTHQFFLTERSMYLLVADSRKEDTDHYFWLQIVQLLSNSSPVLLIQNEKQNRTCTLNYSQLRGEFENLKETHRINLADNRGLTDLQANLQHELEKLIPNGIAFPNKWQAVRYALENDGRNYIDCNEYEVTCRRHGITNRDEIYRLSQFLHDLGICLHFQRDPILCNRLILKPNWGTTAVYKILDNKTVQQNLGQFDDADLADIWKDQQYANMHPALLQLMKEFKVCYEIPRRKEQYIAPHLLSPDSRSYDWNPQGNLILRYCYKSFMPKGILTRFIVEMHRDIENVSDPEIALVWKKGVVLTNGSARAEIIEHYNNREIKVRVSGNRPRDWMTIINHKFQEIHDDFERLDYDTLIPCNCTDCKSNSNPYAFSLDRLNQRIDRRMSTIECHESGKQVNVRGLIDGVIIESAFYEDDFSDDGMEFNASGRPSRGLIRRPKRDRPYFKNNSQNPTVNVTVPVSIQNTSHNNNQQEQIMNTNENNSRFTNNLQGANVANFANEVKDDARQQANQHNYNTQKQSLTESAQEIKALIAQLSSDYDTTTPSGQMVLSSKVLESVEKDPTLKSRVINAIKEAGTTAVEVAIDHPIAKVLVAGFNGYVEG